MMFEQQASGRTIDMLKLDLISSAAAFCPMPRRIQSC